MPSDKTLQISWKISPPICASSVEDDVDCPLEVYHPILSESEAIFQDEKDEGETDPFYDTKLVYDTEDEGKVFEEECGVENQILFLKFVIMETYDYKVHNDFQVFGFFINMVFCLRLLEKSESKELMNTSVVSLNVSTLLIGTLIIILRFDNYLNIRNHG